MKNLVIILGLMLIVFSAFLPGHGLKSGIRGTIEPAEAPKKVWAVSGSDSVSTVPLMGRFSFDVRAGNWKLLIEANQPYKSTSVESVLVVDGQYSDAGVIRLAK